MKKTSFYFLCGLAAIAFCFSISSCQKEVDGNIELGIIDSIPTTTGDSIYLDKIAVLYDDGDGVDTQEIYNFRYDSRKRITEMHDSLLLHPGKEGYYDYYYFYAGNDTLPSKTIFILTEDQASNTYSRDTIYHFYDATGRKVKDSTRGGYTYSGGGSSGSSQFYSIKTYTFGANKMYGAGYGDNIPSDFPFSSRDTAILDAKGNILSSKTYSFDETTSTFELISSSAFTYDTHPHPFSKLSNFRSHYNFPNGETQYGEYAGFNNMLTQHEVSNMGNNIYDYTNIYTYNALGLPVTMIGTFIDGDVSKMIFKYKSL